MVDTSQGKLASQAQGTQPPQKGILTDDEGNLSSMRVISIMCVLTAIGLAFIYVLGGTGAEKVVDLTLLFLVAGTAPKLLQKAVEKWGGIK